MPMNVLLILSGLFLAAAIVNIPLGYLRQCVEKFSFAWYFYVHISIPLIIYLRIKAGYSWKIIPLTVVGAVLGQVIGGRLRRRRDADG
jgi:hypothetical protein